MRKRTCPGIACLALALWAMSALVLVPHHLAQEPHEGDSILSARPAVAAHDHEHAPGHDHEHPSGPDSHAPHHYSDHGMSLRRTATVLATTAVLPTTTVEVAAHDPVPALVPPEPETVESGLPSHSPAAPRAPPTA